MKMEILSVQACFLLLSLTVSTATAWPTVKAGASGPVVVAIQDLLQAHGRTLTSDGSFGPITTTAVKSFQSSSGLSADGVVGPLTWAKLVVTVQSGSSGKAVRAVQYLLANKYNLLAIGGIDSAFGPTTKAAVTTFQGKYSLTKDGIVGPNTWNALVTGGAVPTPTPTPTGSQPCSSTTRSRAGMVAAGMAAISSGKTISYTQGASRWSGITSKKCLPSLPAYADCSSFITWLFWTAYGGGSDFVNHLSWTAGASSTMIRYGTRVSLASAQPGDIVIYIDNAGSSHHVALYAGGSKVISYGSTGPVHLYGINIFSYGTYVIHSYLP